MDINSLVFSDEALNVIDNGAWVGEEVHGFEGLRLKVCGLQSDEARKAMESKQAASRKANKGVALNEDQMKAITREVLAEVVLKDWDGLTDGGKPVAYEREKAIKWLTSRNGEKLSNIVFFCSQKVDANAQSFVETASKN